MRYIFLAACILLISACDMMVAPWHYSDYRQMAKQPVMCEAGTDCDLKWARALKWVKRTSKLPIVATKQTDSLIQTAPSKDLNPDPAFTISKISTGGTSYRIDFEVDCDDWFGCVPPRLKLKASFVEFVMGTSDTIP